MSRRGSLGALPLCLLSMGLVLAGCSSNEQLDSMQSQLSDIQRQVLQLQMQSSSKTEMAELGLI